MKVVQIITSGEKLYGAQNHVFTLCEFLLKYGHEVILITGKGGQLTKKLALIGVKVIVLSSLKRELNLVEDLACFFKMRKLLKKIKPDLVAAHSSKAGIIARIVAKTLHIPNSFTAHGWSFADGIKNPQKIFYKFLERLVGKISNRIIVLSDADKYLALGHKIVPANKLKVINLGISSPITKLPKKRIDNIFTMLMSARFSNQKDHISLINALPYLKEKNWKLILLGDGPNFESIKKLSEDKGIYNQIEFLGMVEDVHKYILQTDVVLLITNWEGFPISILEAMAMGKPIIASNVAGISEQVTHEKNGFLIEKNDSKELCLYIDRLMAHPNLLKQFGNNSEKIFVERFLVEKMIDMTINEYHIIIEETKFVK